MAKVLSPKRSVILVDWLRHNEPTSSNRQALIYELIVLSLLYDEVLIPDEVPVVSEHLARWFKNADDFRMLEELFQIGSVIIMKRPIEKYPAKLQELAHRQPIRARCEHLQEFSVGSRGEPIRFTPAQIRFHSHLESALASNPSAHRHAGLKKGLGRDLMQTFGSLLSIVLTDDRYARWRKRNFPTIRRSTAEDFVRYASDPGEAAALIRRHGQVPKFTPIGNQPAFNTALAIQVAATYPQAEAKSLQRLIETVFSAPFCQDEGAGGKYGRGLRELPLPLNTSEEARTSELVKVEASIHVPIRMPPLGPGFSEVIQRVREGSGRRLRKAMASVDESWHFREQEEAWREVSAVLASNITRRSSTPRMDMWSIAASIGKKLFYAAVADLLFQGHEHITGSPSWLPIKLTGAGMAVGGEFCYGLVRADLNRQEISEKLERTVKFRCVNYPRILPTLGQQSRTPNHKGSVDSSDRK